MVEHMYSINILEEYLDMSILLQLKLTRLKNIVLNFEYKIINIKMKLRKKLASNQINSSRVKNLKLKLKTLEYKLFRAELNIINFTESKLLDYLPSENKTAILNIIRTDYLTVPNTPKRKNLIALIFQFDF